MPRLCFVCTYPPSADGVAPFVQDLAEELAKHTEVVVLAQKRENQEESLHRASVKVLRCWTSALYPFQVAKLVRREGPAIVHIQHEFFLYGQQILSALLFPLLLIFLKLMRRSFIVTAHHVIPFSLVSRMGATAGIQFGFAAKLLLIPYYRTFGLASAVIVPRVEQRNVLIRDYHLAAHKVCVIPHALKFKRGSLNIDTREARGLIKVSAEHIILSFGYIRPAKGLEDLVHSLLILRSSNLDVTLLVVGIAQQRYASYFRWIQETVLELGLSKNVVFVGYVPEESLRLYFCAADVIVFPYKSMEIESSGVFLKAVEFDRPIIATKVGDFLDTERAGICYALVPPSNSPELADAIKRALTNQTRTSSSLTATREFVERHSVEGLAQEYVQLYLKTSRNAKRQHDLIS